MPRTKTTARATESDRELAHRIGQLIREARHRAGLTQQQVAGDRYTKAYVSALETGIARPSMVALNHIAERLNLPVGTVKSRSFRAHKLLALRLGHLRDGPDGPDG